MRAGPGASPRSETERSERKKGERKGGEGGCKKKNEIGSGSTVKQLISSTDYLRAGVNRRERSRNKENPKFCASNYVK